MARDGQRGADGLMAHIRQSDLAPEGRGVTDLSGSTVSSLEAGIREHE